MAWFDRDLERRRGTRRYIQAPVSPSASGTHRRQYARTPLGQQTKSRGSGYVTPGGAVPCSFSPQPRSYTNTSPAGSQTI